MWRLNYNRSLVLRHKIKAKSQYERTRKMCTSENYHYHLHPERTTDILQTIPDNDLPLLRDFFSSRWPHAIQAWTLVNQLIMWKKLNPKVGVRFTSPEGNWQDGTFVVILTEFNYKIYLFTLERSCERLCRGLRETEIIEWMKGPYICAIHEDQDENVMETLKRVSGEIEFDIEFSCWWLPKEIALNFDINCPDNVILRPLSADHSIVMNSIWPHKFPGSEKYLANMISKNGGFGVFTPDSPPVLCSWVTINDLGAAGFLQTIEKYKQKGYAALLLKLLCKTTAERYYLDSVTYNVRKNIVSRSLIESLGFRFNYNVRWVQFKLLENISMRGKL